MIEFLAIQYVLGKVTIEQLQQIVDLGRITQTEYEQIISKPNT